MRMELKERIKYSNKKFTTLLDKVPTASMQVEDILVKIHSNSISSSISMSTKKVSKNIFE